MGEGLHSASKLLEFTWHLECKKMICHTMSIKTTETCEICLPGPIMLELLMELRMCWSWSPPRLPSKRISAVCPQVSYFLWALLCLRFSIYRHNTKFYSLFVKPRPSIPDNYSLIQVGFTNCLVFKTKSHRLELQPWNSFGIPGLLGSYCFWDGRWGPLL